MKEVDVVIGGIPHRIQVDDDYVAPEDADGKSGTVQEPDTKARKPANKSASPTDK